jgi:prepilin-type N-terminal cleavage/methylation domain-containing protein/prepilin-type processing-associated H-X9-DG protein
MKPSLLNRGLTLIEVLVVLGLVAMLASMVTIVIVQVRHFSYQVECQENLRQIGQTLNQIALNNGGRYPLYEEEVTVEDSAGADVVYYVPWWVNVFRQWEGSRDLLDIDKRDTDEAIGIQLPDQVPAAMKSFHCRLGGALAPLGPKPSEYSNQREYDQILMRNWTRTLSYGMNFDVKREDGMAYACYPETNALYPALENPPATMEDRRPDMYFITEIKTPSKFILLSEADTQDPDPINWSGGRIAPTATDGVSENNLHPAPIVGRHDGRANVLFADMHVDMVDVNPEGPWTDNINLNTPFWTLPDD